jgi:hypothetical protein
MAKPLSPAAQAVLDAARRQLDIEWRFADAVAAAVLCAAADQVVPESRFGPPENAAAAQREITRSELLAIAAELEGNAAEPADLSHLSDEQFFDLCPQGHHAPGE